MNPISLAFALTVAGFVAALAVLGMTRRPAPVTAAPRGKGWHRVGSGPTRPRGYRGARRADPGPYEGLPAVLLTLGGAVGAGGLLALVAAGPVAAVVRMFSDVTAILIGFAL